jgi:hypothetical protein
MIERIQNRGVVVREIAGFVEVVKSQGSGTQKDAREK